MVSGITCDHCPQHQESQQQALHRPYKVHLPPALLVPPFLVYPCMSIVKLCCQLYLQQTYIIMSITNSFSRQILNIQCNKLVRYQMQSISKSIKIDQWDGSVNGSISRNHYSCFNFQLQSRPVHST